LVDEGLAYHERGLCIIPIRHKSEKGKEPACRWKQYQARRPSKRTLRRWFGQEGLDGLAVIAGDVSGGLVVRDFDIPEPYAWWAEKHPELARRLPTVKTKRGYHVYHRGQVRRIVQLDDGELRGNGYTLLPPSRHPSGHVYSWVVPLPDGPLPEVDSRAAGLARWAVAARRGATIGRGNGAVGLGQVLANMLPEGFVRGRDAAGERDGCVTQQTQQEQQSQAMGGVGGVVEVRTVADAIEASLPKREGQRNHCVFRLARGLKAVPGLAGAELSALRPHVRAWWERALPVIGTKDWTETWADFVVAWPRVVYPLGEGPMAQAIAQAIQSDVPEAARQYDRPETRLLVAFCRELQRATGDKPFFLGVRDAGKYVGVDQMTAYRWLRMFEADGVLEVVEKGLPSSTARKATMYRYLGD